MQSLKQKLTSRKLWAAIAAAATAIITALFKEDLSPETVDLLSKGIMALCCYIFGEGVVDAARYVGFKLYPDEAAAELTAGTEVKSEDEE